MNKLSPQRARERALFRYRNALERGDFDAVMAVLKMAERDSVLTQMIEEMAELDEAPIARPSRRIMSLFSKTKGITEVVIRRDPSPDGWPQIPDQSEEDNDMFTTFAPARAPQFSSARKLRWDPITLAVAVLVVVVLGMVLLFMRAQFNPGAGGAPEEALPEFAAQPGECDLSMDHLLAGNSALESGDYEAALAEFNCAIKANTTNYDARLGRSFAYLLLGQYARTVPDWIALTYGYTPAWTNALGRYSSAIESAPNDLLLYVQRSYVNWALSEFGQAIEDYDHILALDPENTYALLFRGTSYQFLYEEAAAAADFERVLALVPDNPHVFALIGYFYGQAGQIELGMENLNRAILLDSSIADFYIWRGIIYTRRMWELEKAVADYSYAIELSSEEPAYYYWRGVLYRDKVFNADEQAVSDFNRAIELDPAWASYYLERAYAFEQMGDSASTAAEVMRYIEHIQTAAIDQNVELGESITLPLTVGTVYRIPILSRTGQRLTVRSTGEPTDTTAPISLVLNTENTPVVTSSVSEGTASIRNYEIPANGVYTLLVTLPTNSVGAFFSAYSVVEGDFTFVVELHN